MKTYYAEYLNCENCEYYVWVRAATETEAREKIYNGFKAVRILSIICL